MLESLAGVPLCLSLRRGKISLVVGCFAFLIFSSNPSIRLQVFIIHAIHVQRGDNGTKVTRVSNHVLLRFKACYVGENICLVL